MGEEIDTNQEMKEVRKRGRPRKYDGGWNSVKNEYFHEYYKKNLSIILKCDVCGKEITSKNNLNQHLKNNKKCNFIKMKEEFEKLKKDVEENLKQIEN
jgi:hypothetical protein